MAMRDGYVSKNVVAESQPVPQLRKQRTALTDAEIGAMLDAARARGPQDYALIAVLAGLGGRRGEVCGLRWTEVDFDNQTLAIVAQHKRQKGGTTLGPLKTPAAYRTLPMPSYVFEALNALKEAQEAGEYVFASRTGGAFDPSNLYHRVQSIGVQAGIGKVTPHALRHAMISTLARRGINAQMAQAMAGHADPRMTLGTYTHLATTDLQAAAQALDR